MKKILPLILMLFACHDEAVAPIPPVLEKVNLSAITIAEAKASSSIAKLGNEDILEHGFVYSESNEDPAVGQDLEILKGAIDPATPSPLSLSADLKDLKMNTSYYIRTFAQVTSGTYYGESSTFKTLNMTPPGIRTEAADNITINSARIKGTLTSKGTHNITEYGLVWNTTTSPTTALQTKQVYTDNVTAFPIAFTADIKSLQPNTTYYYRAYAISNGITTYGENLNFKTPAIAQPGIRTDAAANITMNSATLSGTVLTAGSLPITERGIVWGTSAQPTTSNTKASITGNVTTFPNSFNVNATGLTKNTTYHYRAYVISNGVTSYGENKTFATPDATPPGIRTDAATNLSPDGARVGGTILSAGSYAITERGILYGTSQANATTKVSQSGNVTSFPTAFTFDIKGLSKTTSYHYRAYVISNGVTTYGEFRTFTTPDVAQPGIRTDAASNITPTSVRLGGTVLNGGTYAITERGVVYGTSANPTTSNSKSALTGNVTSFPSSFGMDINGLNRNTTYYFRAYVISNGVTSYGENLSFRTPDLVAPGIRTDGAENIGPTSVRLSGTVTSAGSYPITERGIVWSTSTNPTTSNSKSSLSGNVTNFPNTFGMDINGLSPSTAYHYRAYVISNGSTSYGENRTFTTTTVTQPEVRTDGASEVNTSSAKFLGTITQAGTYPISEYGIVYSTSSGPTTSNSKAVAGSGVNNYPYSYGVQVNGLNKNTTYFFRAYLISNGVTSYGAVNTITTPDERPVKIASGQATDVSINFARLSGFIADGGSYPVQEIGVCWSTSPNPTTSNSKASKSGNGVTYPHDYSFDAHGLREGSEYHFRAYAISNGVTYYGQDVAFKTHVVANPSVSTGDNRSLSSSVQEVAGILQSAGTYPITEHGIVYGRNSDINLGNGTKLSFSTPNNLRFPHSYSAQISGLGGISALTYYYRAYCVTSNGSVHYGDIRSFRK
ncbi:hypothetical protein [Leadbetterella byssophila]|uniref:hypothetical protein n=1 Tax=Leadbetterella byssophila TaxID=316068 RepID=UPI0039A2E4B2